MHRPDFLRRLRPAAVLALLVVSGLISAASPPAVEGERGMVVSVDVLASEVGVDVLRTGGNAIDAAVAVAFTLAATYPAAGNLGGGGFLLYRDADGGYHALDFRETAPAAIEAAAFLDEAGKPVPDRSRRGGLAVGTPGSVAGWAEAHRRWGSRPWAELLAPAIRLAAEGFTVSDWNATTFARRGAPLLEDPAAAAVFAPAGTLPARGDRLRQPELAESLRRIAGEGADGFYRGPTAEAVVRSVRGAGGVISLDDLAAYRPRMREPLRGSYRGHEVVSFPPPSSGGVALLQLLAMLERFDLAALGAGSSATLHLMAEAERRAFADRSRWLGDPDAAPVPVDELLDADYLARRSRSIRPRRASRSKKVRPLGGFEAAGEGRGETTHFSIVGPGGDVVSATTTLNSWFGAALVAEGTGILLNNEMDDFSMAPGRANQHGLVGGTANAVAPGKRPLSSMTPTIVEADGRAALVLGSPGGPTIITTVAQVLINVIDHRMPLQEAVDAPRLHHQWLPDRIDHEPRALPADVARALRRRGHELHLRESIGNVSAIAIDERGRLRGAADPRRQGSARGF